MTTATEETIATAEKAFTAFKLGIATGNWTEFLAMLTDDVTFSFPVAPYQGNNVGKDKIAAFLRYASDKVFSEGLTLTPISITSNLNTVVFEALSEGKMWGKPYQNRVAVAFDVRNSQICGYREYLAVIYQLS